MRLVMKVSGMGGGSGNETNSDNNRGNRCLPSQVARWPKFRNDAHTCTYIVSPMQVLHFMHQIELKTRLVHILAPPTSNSCWNCSLAK